MAKFTKLADVAAVNAVIDGIAKDSSKFNDRVQNAAVNVVLHTAEHGDERLGQRLYDAMGKGMRADSLAKWFINTGLFFVEQGKIKLNKETRAAIHAKLSNDAEVVKLHGAKWFEAKKAPTLDDIDVEKLYEAMIKRVKNAKEGQEVKNAELLTALQVAHDAFYRDSAE
jgi:hypothetical protein